MNIYILLIFGMALLAQGLMMCAKKTGANDRTPEELVLPKIFILTFVTLVFQNNAKLVQVFNVVY